MFELLHEYSLTKLHIYIVNELNSKRINVRPIEKFSVNEFTYELLNHP